MPCSFTAFLASSLICVHLLPFSGNTSFINAAPFGDWETCFVGLAINALRVGSSSTMAFGTPSTLWSFLGFNLIAALPRIRFPRAGSCLGASCNFMQRASFCSGNFLSHGISASVSSKFLLTTLNEQSAGVDSYSMMAFELFAKIPIPCPVRAVNTSMDFVVRSYHFEFVKMFAWLIYFNTRSKHRDVHGVHGRTETRLLSLPNSNSSCNEISFGKI